MTWSVLYLVIRTLHLFGWITLTSREVDPHRCFNHRVFQKLAKFNLQRLLFFLGLFFWLLLQPWCLTWLQFTAGLTELRQDLKAWLVYSKVRLSEVHMHEIAFKQNQTLLNMLSNQDDIFVHSTHTVHIYMIYHFLSMLMAHGLWAEKGIFCIGRRGGGYSEATEHSRMTSSLWKQHLLIHVVLCRTAHHDVKSEIHVNPYIHIYFDKKMQVNLGEKKTRNASICNILGPRFGEVLKLIWYNIWWCDLVILGQCDCGFQ